MTSTPSTATSSNHIHTPNGHASPNGDAAKPHGIGKLTQALKRLSGNHDKGEKEHGPGSGKAHARHEHHRIVKEEKEERIKSERQSLDQQRAEEDEQARISEDPSVRELYGELVHPGEIISVKRIGDLGEGQEVTFRARIHTQRKVSAALDFLLFRDQTDTVQGVLHREDGSAHMVKWTQRLPPEAIVQVSGQLSKPKEPVKSATVHDLEVTIHSIHLVADAHDLPFDLYHEDSEPVHKRLENRIVDLRHPSNQAVFRIRSKIMQSFRETLYKNEFIELSTPKLQPAATESGAEVFKVNYFGRTAFLAQSPQLAKQMAISADFGRVFEVGPVFRAENSNTHRHLTEYTGLDIEMTITKDYYEIVHVLTKVLKNIFSAVYSMRAEIDRVKERWPSEDLVWLDETPIIPFTEGIQMLRDDGRDVEVEDLSTRDEIRLGELVKEKYKTDFYVLDKFPKSARPFYTMTDGDFTNSFDMFVRGQEICTGGQRINDPKKLRLSMKDAGIDEQTMSEYLEAFDWGVLPHGGAGLGLERVVFLILNLGNVRFATLFHRDPKSLPKKPKSLPHPDASTLRKHDKDNLPPIEEMIANYGDATNTSWLDDRFEIWRHPHTAAAVGYVKQKKFVMIAGDPLCDKSQYQETIESFLKFVSDELKLTPIWMLVGTEVQEHLAGRLRWRTLTCTEEQRVDSDALQSQDYSAQSRRLEREGVEISEEKLDDELKSKVDKRIDDWKAERSNKGKQVHLTEIQPWKDPSHRRYFIAEKEGVVQAMVVLAQLSPEHGWQVKWALDFPKSVNGSIEVLVSRALASVQGPVTFGAGVSEKLVPGHHLHGMRARFLSRSYAAVTNSLHLNRKSQFREKFGTVGDPVWICYPKNGVGATDLNEIVKFFED